MTAAVRADHRTARREAAWWWGRLAATVVPLGVLVWRLGATPFLDGLRTVDAGALAATVPVSYTHLTLPTN